MTTLDHELTTTGARCCSGHLGLALFPEREPEVWGFVEEVVNRSKNGRFPQMNLLWASFGVHVGQLTRQVTWRVHNDLWRASLHAAANDDKTRDCPSCAWPRRAIVNAEAIGRGLATLISAFRRGDAAALRRGADLFPANLDEGHILPLGVLKRSFRRWATELGLSPIDVRSITKAIDEIDRIERCTAQLSFDFARAA